MTFKTGQSGNPGGRPKGIVDKRTQLRSLIQPHAEDLVNKLVERAKLGDSWAMKLCIDRLIPPMKKDDAIFFDDRSNDKFQIQPTKKLLLKHKDWYVVYMNSEFHNSPAEDEPILCVGIVKNIEDWKNR